MSLLRFSVCIRPSSGWCLPVFPNLFDFTVPLEENTYSIKLIYCLIISYVTDNVQVGLKSLTTLCKSQSMRNRWITTICDLIRPRGRSLGG
jgi:hypothetical protein